ncbi:D-aminoacid aminotransferase-like PLP-dependent enzyme [Aspergillus ambiguus]|uniref:D-aminoacid aminotransferase-like PLP-dependent enzyme n=1 Tax=Aspergillus ambiguus TaxID=176160 RepID=UPI003CCCB41C
MSSAVWHSSTGWEAPELKPYGPLAIMPNAPTAAMMAKYVYYAPDCNAHRMRISVARVALPDVDPHAFVALIEALLEVDADKFLPMSQPGSFLYLRPAMIGMHEGLGPHAPDTAMLFIIATYMPEMGEQPLRVMASGDGTIRAWPGGFGYAKVGSNYGPALVPALEARRSGYDQVLWLFGEERWVTECGPSNFFVVWRTREGQLQLVKAPLDDRMILDGVTRRSILQLVREMLSGPHSPHEGATIGEYTAAIKAWIRDIMYGREDHDWGVECKHTRG